jgi:hypothetical protein
MGFGLYDILLMYCPDIKVDPPTRRSYLEMGYVKSVTSSERGIARGYRYNYLLLVSDGQAAPSWRML